MEVYNKKSVSDKLNKYTHLAKEGDYIEVSEWKNGEGWDIDINEKKHFSLTYGELDAINYLTRALDIEDK